MIDPRSNARSSRVTIAKSTRVCTRKCTLCSVYRPHYIVTFHDSLSTLVRMNSPVFYKPQYARLHGQNPSSLIRKFVMHVYCHETLLYATQSYTLPLPKNTPPSTPICQHQSPPNPPFPDLDNSLPHSSPGRLLFAEAIITLPH